MRAFVVGCAKQFRGVRRWVILLTWWVPLEVGGVLSNLVCALSELVGALRKFELLVTQWVP